MLLGRDSNEKREADRQQSVGDKWQLLFLSERAKIVGFPTN